MNPLRKDAKTMAALMQIYGKRAPEVAQQLDDDIPDISDGVDLAIIIMACWLACFVAGIVYGSF